MQNETNPINQSPRRRKRTKLQIFKEAYLPTIILAVTIVLVLVFIIGGTINRHKSDEPQLSDTPSTTTETSTTEDPRQEQWEKEAVQLIIQADGLAKNYDYEGAIAVLDSFGGDASQFPALTEARSNYAAILENMVAWNAADVPNLSFHMLIADPARAFPDSTYGGSYKKNFVTVAEFSAILQQLYDNSYVLVGLDDLYDTEYNSTSGREFFVEKELLLPAGKKPIMITETNANYYSYMIDSNNDGKPDAGADGFAARLCWDGNFYNELINADGSISYGAYDLVPILEAFIAANPDFSYKGARATIAFSGYDGILGYRINSTALSEAALQEEREGAAAVVQALKDAGYDLACYSFSNPRNYASMNSQEIKDDLQKWIDQITPWLGEVDIMVFPWEADIGDEGVYDNGKFNVLYQIGGFRYFMGSSESAWNQVSDLYVRHNRISVSGYNLINNASWFDGMFDAAAVLDSARP